MDMKSFYLILITFPFLLPSFNGLEVQSINTTKKEFKQNFKAYYHYVNLSNRLIYIGDLSKAAIYLDSAFSNINVPYFKDLQKRVILNWKLNKSDKNIDLLNYIIKAKHIDTAQLRLLFPKEIINNFKTKLKPDRLSVKMQDFRYQLEWVFKTDQEIKGYYDDKILKIDNNTTKAKKEKQELLELANANKFFNLIRKYGYPTEDNLSYFISNTEDVANIKSIELSSVMDILLRNYLGTKFKEDALRVLESAMANHLIHPVLYANLKDHYHQNLKDTRFNWGIQYLIPSVIIIDKAYYRPFVYYSKGLLDSINNNRISIGLDSLHIEQHQIVSQQICSDSLKYSKMSIPSYAFIDQYHLGFVKWAVEKEGKTMNDFLINTSKIKRECKCE